MAKARSKQKARPPFGGEAMPPSGMTKKLWGFVKKNSLATKG